MFKYLWIIILITAYLIWVIRSVMDIKNALIELLSDENPASRKSFWERFLWKVDDSSIWCIGLTIGVLITISFVSWILSFA